LGRTNTTAVTARASHARRPRFPGPVRSVEVLKRIAAITGKPEAVLFEKVR
jgi:hypothetical protein